MAVNRVNLMDAVDKRSHVVARERTALVRVGVVESNDVATMTVNVKVGDAVLPARSFVTVSPGAVVAVLTDTDAWWILGDLGGRKGRANEAWGSVTISGHAANVATATPIVFPAPLVGSGPVRVFMSHNSTTPASIHLAANSKTLSGFTLHSVRDVTTTYTVDWHAIADL
jgi:hypothetical protein